MKFLKISVYCVLFCSINNTWAFSVTDDQKHVVQLEKPATRIISLAPDITEILFALGAGSQIVGVIAGSDYPLAAKNITLVGSYRGLDLERIVMLHPDLVINWSNNFFKQIAILKTLNIPVYTTAPQKLEDISHSLAVLGILTGKGQAGLAQAAQFNQSLNTLRKQYANAPQYSVFYQLGSYGLLTINKESWINQVITLCHGHNIFAQVRNITPMVSLEAVLNANPQVIITDSKDPNWTENWKKWHKIEAVRNGSLYAIPPEWIDRAGPRLLWGAKRMCEQIQASHS